MKLQNLSLQQLEFSLAGVRQDSSWENMEKQIPLEKQAECIEALSFIKNPEPVIQRLIVAKRLDMVRKPIRNR